MLKRIKNDEYDEVIVYKLDRLTRNVIDVYHLLQMFLEMDVNLIAILDNLDIKTANGRLLVGMLAIIAQWERETIVERTNDGLMQMALEGKYPIKGFPFGYYKDEKNFLYIDPKTRPIVRLIFRLAQRGHIYTEIAYKVNFQEQLRRAIDAALEERPKDFEDFLKKLEAAGIEVNRERDVYKRQA